MVSTFKRHRLNTALRSAVVLGASLAVLAGAPAQADGLFGFGRAKSAAAEQQIEPVLDAVNQALAEGRLVDAGRILDSAYAAGAVDPRLLLCSGELQLARERYDEAIVTFSQAEASAPLKARAMQGRGMALSKRGRPADAVPVLEEAVRLDPSLWRAWNTLGVERDRRHDWAGAADAYEHALKAPDASAIVLNNRGYSLLLQEKYREASNDFVLALQKDPGLSGARTNLRLSLALQGDYQRATSVSGTEDRASVLNNAGFAAVLRGDLNAAEGLFKQAIDVRGSSYGRAIENLQMVKALQASNAQLAARAP